MSARKKTAKELKARKVQFEWEQTPLHWVPGDAFTTHAMNPLHVLLPAGELWFCRVYNKALPMVTDERIREEVKGFIRQEAIHSRSHARVLDFYREKGLDTRKFEVLVELLFNRVLDEPPLEQKWLGKLLGDRWVVMQVGLIAAIEHFTCVLGRWVLEERSLEDLDPVMLDLCRWHGAEEVEHRSVAFDLFEHLCETQLGFYLSRQALMVIVAPMFLGVWFKCAQFMMHHDATAPELNDISFVKVVAEFERVAQQKKKLPSLGVIIGSLGRWALPTYHPRDEAPDYLADEYLAMSPAALAAQ